MKRYLGRKVLFPTRIALLLFVPSLILYLFFNTWPMIFSIGIAFTNADRFNISPDPQRIEDLRNAISCAETLKVNETLKQRVVELLDPAVARLDRVARDLEQIKAMLEEGVEPQDIPLLYFESAYRSARGLARLREDFGLFFDCTTYGYLTRQEIVPGTVLRSIDSLITLTATLVQVYQTMSRDDLYERVSTGVRIASELRDYLFKLESDYEGFLDDFILDTRRNLESLELRFIGLENFVKLFSDPRFYNSIFKTLLFVATSVPLKVSFGVLLALFYSSTLLYGRKIMRTLLLVPWAIPFLLSALTWRFLFLPNGVLGQLMKLNVNVNEWDAFLVYNLFETWLAYPFIMTITQGALRGVSKDIIEAAYIDGASLWMRLRKVVFPQIARPVLVATVLTTGASLQVFLVPLVINGAGPHGEVCVQHVGCTPGLKNEMLIVFGYNRVMRADEGFYGYAASIYIVVLALVLVYVFAWFKLMKRAR
ncbi:MAG: sugar ABC transporter permease [Desulfurococcaceae archaeon]